MADPFIAAARHLLHDTLDEMRAAIDGASSDALNWRPAGDASNSMSVLTVHALHSTRSWLSVATGAPLPERDRPSEFRAEIPDAAALLALIDAMGGDCRRLLKEASGIDWAAMRATHARPNSGDAEEVPAAWALLHALQHLREHAGQLSLTRQLAETRA